MTPQHARRRAVTLVALALATLTSLAAAQGFPGGGGGHGGHGMRPSGGVPHDAGAKEAPRVDPLVAFFGNVRALRMEIMTREDQAAAWMSMQDALRDYVGLDPAAGFGPRTDSGDVRIHPSQRVRAIADDARARADALKKVADAIDALSVTLDDRQRKLFAQRLDEAFAAHAAP